ncbi:unnamed protein product, partial [Ectocarpus sp. 8 AP-2014]
VGQPAVSQAAAAPVATGGGVDASGRPVQAHGTGNGLSWQSNNDIPSRKEILSKIVTYLQQRKPNARPEWIQKVPLMAKRLEDSLYRNAKSFEEYKDHATLRQRLQQLAARLGTNAQQNRA